MNNIVLVKKFEPKFSMKDYGFIVDCKVGYMDNEKYKHYKWYEVWRGIILRCYDRNSKQYGSYGARGVYISDEFHTASIFRDFYLENNPTGELVVDKDKNGLNCYSREGISFITQKENIKIRKKTNEKNIDGIKTEKNKKEKREHSIEWYENNPVSKHNFKRACKKYSVNYNNFEEIFSHFHRYPAGRIVEYFTYKMKE